MIEVRCFKRDDLAQVLVLCNQVREYHRDILNGYFTKQDDDYEQINFLDSLQKNSKMLAMVAVDGAIIEGYILAELKNSQYLEKTKVAHIQNIGVIDKRRGEGIGKLLMKALFLECKRLNVDEVKLGVFNKNKRAYIFYEALGFQPQEQRMSLMVESLE